MAIYAYSAFEVTNDDAIKDVQALCNHLTDNGLFTASTRPTLATVERWLTLSFHIVRGYLTANGYAAAQTDAEVVGILQSLQVLETVIKIELSHPITGFGEPNERFKAFISQRDVLLKLLESSGFEELGATVILTEVIDATGISQANKKSLEDDADHIPHRFKRGQFRQLETINPSGDSAVYP